MADCVVLKDIYEYYPKLVRKLNLKLYIIRSNSFNRTETRDNEIKNI